MLLRSVPLSVGASGVSAYEWMPLITLGVFLSVQWWAAWYPGAEPGGGGYVAQRIFSAKTERDGFRHRTVHIEKTGHHAFPHRWRLHLR